MNKKYRVIKFLALIAIIFFDGCVYAQPVSINVITSTYSIINPPTIIISQTPPITITDTSFAINTPKKPTVTLLDTSLKNDTPTIITDTEYLNCNVTNGIWNSIETIEAYESKVPIISLVIKNCQIIGWEIWTYPLPWELFSWMEPSNIPIIDNSVAWEVESDYGTFYITGLFTSQTNSHGIILIPKGYIFHEKHINEDIAINWTAKLGKEKW